MELNVDDRVILTTARHGKTRVNPCWDSMYKCVGTVTETEKGRGSDYPLHVEWDNGYGNIYEYGDLSLVSSEKVKANNPNIAFRKMVQNGCYSRGLEYLEGKERA